MQYASTLLLKFSVRYVHPNYLFYCFKCVRGVCPNLSSAPCISYIHHSGDPVILPHYLPSLHIPPVPLILWPSIYISYIRGSRYSSSLSSFPTYCTSPTHPMTIHIHISHIFTIRGIPLFFLTICLPYIIHQSHSSWDHPYISYIYHAGVPVILRDHFHYIFHQSHPSCDLPYISRIFTTRGILLFLPHYLPSLHFH